MQPVKSFGGSGGTSTLAAGGVVAFRVLSGYILEFNNFTQSQKCAKWTLLG